MLLKTQKQKFTVLTLDKQLKPENIAWQKEGNFVIIKGI